MPFKSNYDPHVSNIGNWIKVKQYLFVEVGIDNDIIGKYTYTRLKDEWFSHFLWSYFIFEIWMLSNKEYLNKMFFYR